MCGGGQRSCSLFKGQKWSRLAKIGRPNFVVISSFGGGGGSCGDPPTKSPPVYYSTLRPINPPQATTTSNNKRFAHLLCYFVSHSEASPAAGLVVGTPPQVPLPHTKLEPPQVTGGGPGRRCQVGRCLPKSGPFGAQSRHLLAPKGPRPCPKRPSEGKRSVHSTTGFVLSRQRALCCALPPRCSRETPQKGPQTKAQNLSILAANSPKPRTGHILGSVAQRPR